MYVRSGNGGGVLTPTTLWTNSDTSQNWGTGTMNLSEDINNYQYVEIECNRSVADNRRYKTGLYPVTDVIGYTGNDAGRMSVQFRGTSNSYTRAFLYVSDTSLQSTQCNQFGTTTYANNSLIPYRVIGYK